MKNDLWFAWYDYQIYLMVQMKFMSPARMIAQGSEMEKFMKHFSLNGIKPMCAM
jgi:hypothetical protein